MTSATLDVSAVKSRLQDFLQEGLLLVAGSGLSAAEGMPGMGALAAHLKATVPVKIAANPDPAWKTVADALDAGDHLEAAMGKATLKPLTVDAIVAETAELIATQESLVFDAVLAGRRRLPFSDFAKHLFKAGKRFNLITPNYDRLIELAAEVADIGVDTRFAGYLYGYPDPKKAADAHRESYYNGRTPSLRPLPCLSIFKPHGSLDWFDVGGKVIRCPHPVSKVPFIITPGISKYRESFRAAFDDHRTAGNRCVASATRLMFIGYGFNDDHLEQQLCPGLCVTKPTVIVARDLSDNAKKVIANSSQTELIALCAAAGDASKTQIIVAGRGEITVNEELWHLEGFNKGIL